MRKALKEWKAADAEEALGWIDSEIDDIETLVGKLLEHKDTNVVETALAIQDKLDYIRSDCINHK